MSWQHRRVDPRALSANGRAPHPYRFTTGTLIDGALDRLGVGYVFEREARCDSRPWAPFGILSLREVPLCGTTKQSSWIAAARFAQLKIQPFPKRLLANGASPQPT